MPEGNKDEGVRWWVQAVQTLGVSTAAFFLLGFWANRTVEWERDKFLPAIERSNSVVQSNNEALRQNNEVISAVKSSVDELNRRNAYLDRKEHGSSNPVERN